MPWNKLRDMLWYKHLIQSIRYKISKKVVQWIGIALKKVLKGYVRILENNRFGAINWIIIYKLGYD